MYCDLIFKSYLFEPCILQPLLSITRKLQGHLHSHSEDLKGDFPFWAACAAQDI